MLQRKKVKKKKLKQQNLNLKTIKNNRSQKRERLFFMFQKIKKWVYKDWG